MQALGSVLSYYKLIASLLDCIEEKLSERKGKLRTVLKVGNSGRFLVPFLDLCRVLYKLCYQCCHITAGLIASLLDCSEEKGRESLGQFWKLGPVVGAALQCTMQQRPITSSRRGNKKKCCSIKSYKSDISPSTRCCALLTDGDFCGAS